MMGSEGDVLVFNQEPHEYHECDEKGGDCGTEGGRIGFLLGIVAKKQNGRDKGNDKLVIVLFDFFVNQIAVGIEQFLHDSRCLRMLIAEWLVKSGLTGTTEM